MTVRPAPVWLTCLTCLTCLVVLGCGSDDEPSGIPTGEDAAVAAAAKSYLTSIGNLDAAGVCNSLTEAAQRELVAKSGVSNAECEDVMRLGFQGVTPEQKLALAEQKGLEPLGIQVNGTKATGQLQFRGQTSQFEAEKVGGQWKLSSPGEEQIVAE